MNPAEYGKRTDGTPKGLGYFGELRRTDDPSKISTELSMSFGIDGKDVLFPLIVPTLSRQELDHVLAGNKPTKSIMDKAFTHGLSRLKAGKSPFAGPKEQVPLPQSEQEAFRQGFQK